MLAHYLQEQLFALGYSTLTVHYLCLWYSSLFFPAWKDDSVQKLVHVHPNPRTPKHFDKYFNITCKLRPWFTLCIVACWAMIGCGSPSLCVAASFLDPPSNSLFLMPWWFSTSEGLFFPSCSIQRSNHGNGSLTLGCAAPVTTGLTWIRSCIPADAHDLGDWPASHCWWTSSWGGVR